MKYKTLNFNNLNGQLNYRLNDKTLYNIGHEEIYTNNSSHFYYAFCFCRNRAERL